MPPSAKPQQKIESLGKLTLPPYSTEAEAALLGGMMLDPEGQAYDKIADIVSIQDFYHPENKRIFTKNQNYIKEAVKVLVSQDRKSVV